MVVSLISPRLLKFSAKWSTFVLWMTLGTVLWAQTVRWDPASGTLGEGQTSTLKLVFDQCGPENDVTLPTVSGLEFGNPSQSKSMSVINFKVSQSYVLSYPVRPTQKGNVEIPSFEVLTTKGVVKVPAAKFEIGEMSLGHQPARDVIKSFLRFQPPSVWQGEVFGVEYTLYVSQQNQAQVGGGLEWKSNDIVMEDWRQGENIQGQFDGAMFNGLMYKTRACALKSGSLQLPSVQQEIEIVTGGRDFGFFSQPKVDRVKVKSQTPVLEVKPLPQAPPEFGGAVGSFTFKGKVVPLEVGVGEPVTWTVELKGTGNWPAGINLPSRSVPKAWRVIQPKPKLEIEKDKRFEGSMTEDLVVMPSAPGTHVLPSVTFVYFDPASGSYKTIKTEPVTIRVTGTALPVAQPPSATASSHSMEPPKATLAQLPLPSSVMPEPIHGAQVGSKPWPPALILILCVVPWIGLFGLIIYLARRKSWATDAYSPSRMAAQRLKTLLESEKDSVTLARAWITESSILWGLNEAVPTSHKLEQAIRAKSGNEAAESWQPMVREAESALYSSTQSLPEEWRTCALQLLNSHFIPKPKWRALIYRKNWFPYLLILLLMPAFAVAASEAELYEQGVKAYQSGDFDHARQLCDQELGIHPLNVSARLLSSMLFKQKGDDSSAAIESARAFLLAPGNASVRQMAEMLWEPGASFLTGRLIYGSLERVCRIFPPALSCWLLTFSIVALSFLIGERVARRHGLCRGISYKIWKFLMLTCVAGAVLMAGIRFAWGPLVNPHAGWVINETRLYSIPSEADKQSAGVPPRVAGVEEKEFLGWLRVRLENGAQGWIRKKDWAKTYPEACVSP